MEIDRNPMGKHLTCMLRPPVTPARCKRQQTLCPREMRPEPQHKKASKKQLSLDVEGKQCFLRAEFAQERSHLVQQAVRTAFGRGLSHGELRTALEHG